MPVDIASQICPNTNLLACCPLSHLLANASSPEGRAEKRERIFSFSAQTKLVSPFGRDVAQRQRGLLPVDIASQICPNMNLLACCPLSHLLANASSPEGRAEKPERIFAFPRSPNLSLPLGEMSRSDREGIAVCFSWQITFPSKKALRGVLFFYLFSWMCCRMLGCLRCCRCFPCFRCLLPHRSLRSVPNPHP